MSKTKYLKVKYDFIREDLSHMEWSVLSYLASLTTEGKQYCYASNSHICESLKINDRTLYRILSNLEVKELIIRETKSNGHYGKQRKIFVSPTVKMAYHI